MVPAIIPRFGRVLVKLAEKQGAKAATTQSGLHLPQSVTHSDSNYQVGFITALPVDESDESRKLVYFSYCSLFFLFLLIFLGLITFFRRISS